MKKSGFTLIETLIGVSIGMTVLIGFLTLMVQQNKTTSIQIFVNEAYDIVKAVDHRISIDGYSPTTWNKTSWVDENEIVDSLINKELTAKESTDCADGTWEPISAAAKETKLLKCKLWSNRKKNGEKMSAEIKTDSAGFIRNFSLYINIPNKDDFKDRFMDIKKAMNKASANLTQEIAGTHYIDLVSWNTKTDITSKECLTNTADCAIRFMFDRSGGSEYLRVDGMNSMIASHVTFIESKGSAPLKCIRWKNTERDGTGTWSKELDQECGIGIYKNDPHPVMVDVLADTGTFKSVVLDKECKVFGWNGTTVIDTGRVSPCGITKEDATDEIVQVIDNIQSKESQIGTLYAGEANINKLFINEIVAKKITSEVADITSQLRTDLISSYSAANLITFNSNITLREMVNMEKNLYVNNDVFVGRNNVVTGIVNAGGGIISNGEINANENINVNKINVEGASCTTLGAISRNTEGNILNCVNNIWTTTVSNSVPVGTIIMWTSLTIPDDWVIMQGQSTSPYPELRAIIGSTIPDMRGVVARGLDMGRGLDSASTRFLGSYQDDATQKFTAEFMSFDRSKGWRDNNGIAKTVSRWSANVKSGNSDSWGTFVNIDNSRQNKTAEETRMKNVALFYLIKVR